MADTATSSESELTGCKLNMVTIEIEGLDSPYICTSVVISMEVDNIPSATVTIGAGTSILDTSQKQTPEKILEAILGGRDSSTSAYSRMAGCEIWEELTDSSARLVFSGVVTAGSLVYRTGTPTLKVIRLTCMNKAALLLSSPLGVLEHITGHYLMTLLDAKLNRGSAFSQMTGDDPGQTNELSIIEGLNHTDNPTLDTRLADVVDEVVYRSGYALRKTGTAKNDFKSLIRECFMSDTTLSDTPGNLTYDQKGMTLSIGWDKELYDELCRILPGNSLYNAVQRVLLSEQFMLSFVPRYTKQDFRLEITPSRAWDAGTVLQLPPGKVHNFNATYNPLACLNTPDVFIVNFSDAVSTLYGGNLQGYVGCPGVYSLDQDVTKAWKASMDPESKGDYRGSLDMKNLRARIYRAPSWLMPLVLTPGTLDARGSLKDMRTPENADDVNDLQSHAQAAPAQIEGAGDVVAKALFAHLYGREDKCSLRLLPSVRADGLDGELLEDHLGDTIRIDFDKESERSMNLQGMLSSINYAYTGGAGGCVLEYSIGLSRVRSADSTFSVSSPVYVTGK